MKNLQKGFVVQSIIGLLTLLLIAGGAYYAGTLKKLTSIIDKDFVEDSNMDSLVQEKGDILIRQLPISTSTLNLVNVELLPTPHRGANITEFSLGQVFEISTIFNMSNSLSEIDLKNINIEVSVPDGRVVAVIELECEKTQNIFYCANNVWNTSNLQSGQKQYKFSVSGTDSLKKKVLGSIVREFTFKDVSKNLCKAVYSQNNIDNVNENKFNLVFVGSGYSNVIGESFSEVFTKVSSKLIDLNAIGHGLFSIDPFRGNKDLFNFWYIDKSYPLEQCTLINNSCPREDILKLAENCQYPNSYVVEVHDRNAYDQEVGASARSIVVAMPYFKFSDPTQFADIDSLQRTFVHEFGHTFSDLGDEYVLFPEQKSTPVQINIQKLKSIFQAQKNIFYGTLNECQKEAPWRNIAGTGCFEGAGKIGFNAFRPTENSLMRDQFLDPFTFGAYNSSLIIKTFDHFLIKSKIINSENL
ncbi:MAG: M64 family metallopeptidase [Candidatus Paceibacterota bacterium]|jgi:hypothetical protein